jgi:hypothetical protein
MLVSGKALLPFGPAVSNLTLKGDGNKEIFDLSIGSSIEKGDSIK